MNVSTFNNYIFSSAITDLHITTSDTKVDVTFIDTTHSAVFLQVALDIYQGAATLYDTREAIEEYMKSEGLSYLCLEMQVQGANSQSELSEITRHIIFCEDIIADAATDRFLTSLRSKRIPKDQTERVHYFDPGNGSLTLAWKFYTTTNGGTTITSSTQNRQMAAQAIGVKYVDVSYTSVMNDYHLSGDLLAATLTIGNRYMVFYYVDEKPDLVLTFRNTFNINEKAFLRGVTKSKTSSQKSTATCGGIDSFYDIDNSIEYQFESAPLALSVAVWLQQLVLSPYIIKGNEEILIKDHTCEISDADDGLNTIKFTYQHTDGRPRIEPVPVSQGQGSSSHEELLPSSPTITI